MRRALQLIVVSLVLGALARPLIASPGILGNDVGLRPEMEASASQEARARKTAARVARRLHLPRHQSLYLRRAYVFEKHLFARYGLRYRGVPVEQSTVLVRLPEKGGFEIREHKHVPLPARLHIDVRPKVSASAARKALLSLTDRPDVEPELVIRLVVTRKLGDPGEGRSYWTSDDVIETATGYRLLYRGEGSAKRFVVDARTGVATDERSPRRKARHGG